VGTRIVLVELNEVPFTVLDRYAAGHPRGFLARALARAAQYETFTEDEVQLDPWISWATLHRGVIDREHGILHLGQDLEEADAATPPLWRLLAAAGRTPGVFGSLHSSHLPLDLERYAFYLPDYFADQAAAWPPLLERFQRFNLAMTRASARNVTRALPLGAAAGFLRDLPRLGLSAGTAAAIAAQLAAEPFAPRRRTRRRNIQPLLMYDVFERLWRRTGPEFATFYTNHVAAAMHRYWAAAFPQDYEREPLDAAWRTAYRDEIDEALGRFQAILRRLLRLAWATPGMVVLVASAMGQDAIPAERTFSFLTITDIERFMAAMGVPEGCWQARPAMVPCLSVAVDEPWQGPFREALLGLTLDGQAMAAERRPLPPLSFDEREGGTFHHFVQADGHPGEGMVVIGGREQPLAAAGLGLMAHEDGVNCTAQHVREGSLLVFDPRARRPPAGERRRVSTLDVAPSILRALGVPVPPHMRGAASIRPGADA
jgi:hypothetical protein